jgi:NitT/TauT family transport system substrate-binding protein
MKRSSFLWLPPVAGLGLASAAGAQELISVKVGIVPSITNAPMFIADKKGFLREEGLVSDYQTFDSAASMMAPLGAGQLDVVAGGTSAGLFNAVSRGIDMRVVADKASARNGCGFAPFLVSSDAIKSGKYKSLKDIKGWSIAISAPGSSSWPELNAVALKAGLKFSDVNPVALDYPDHVIGFKSGSVQASVTIEPFATQILQAGSAQKIMGNDAFYPDQEVAVIIYGGPFMKGKRDVALRWMRAYMKGARYYYEAVVNGKLVGRNAEDVITILTQTTNIKDPNVFRQLVANGVNPDGRVNVASMQKDLDFYREQGLIQGTIKASDTVDLSFADEVVKQLGPYRKG